ncbi:helix-turn-helix domain-containing protein [Dickeya zeae]|uniref:Helix-turn-helix transcriptional regulator n=1 Tax=Dickeya zeae TaxID=204042 RepID=A0AAE6YVT1_9GAMM|nr:helix-turn-helix transcriptional regulator [Dickeya zeae]QIZ49379.1 XRE family transcriptional regulator [Dickeya zeae]QYM92885.1 helix-turn-helix transcriptional regulator [Dickeya zeae]
MLSLYTAYDIQQKFKQHLKAMRKYRKLSVDALAQQSGVPNSTIRKFEATGNISLRQFLMLYEVLGNLNDLNALTSQVHAPTSIEEVLKNA